MNSNRKRYLVSHGLEYDAGYLIMSDEDIERICNGCGPIKETNYFIPQSFVGLDISEACHIHDYDYVMKPYGRKTWDQRFLRNMDAIIEYDAHKTNGFTTWLRRRKARAYYYCVRIAGGMVFDVAKDFFK
jgi:hypothetical protein